MPAEHRASTSGGLNPADGAAAWKGSADGAASKGSADGAAWKGSADGAASKGSADGAAWKGSADSVGSKGSSWKTDLLSWLFKSDDADLKVTSFRAAVPVLFDHQQWHTQKLLQEAWAEMLSSDGVDSSLKRRSCVRYWQVPRPIARSPAKPVRYEDYEARHASTLLSMIYDQADCWSSRQLFKHIGGPMNNTLYLSLSVHFAYLNG